MSVLRKYGDVPTIKKGCGGGKAKKRIFSSKWKKRASLCHASNKVKMMFNTYSFRLLFSIVF